MARKKEVIKTENIVDIDLVDEVENSFLTYAISKISSALPSVYDGLTVVQRRILWAFYTLNRGKRTKTAQVVGTVIGNLHPHGDSGVAGAIATLARPFGVNHNLIFSDSSMGSIDGDGEAAPRYTEVELSKFALDAFFDPMLLKVTDMIDNYLATEKEPSSFVTWCPPLVTHNNSKISVAYATNYPALNLNEVVSFIEYLCKKNAKSKDVGKYTVTDEEVMKYIQGPDFDSGCTIFNVSKREGSTSVRDFLVNGSTTLYMMPKIELVKASKKVRGGMADELVIREIPWGITTERIMDAIRNANIKLLEGKPYLATGIGANGRLTSFAASKNKEVPTDNSYILKGRDGLVNYSRGVDNVEIRIGLKLGTDPRVAFNSICEILLKDFNLSVHVTMVDDKGKPYRRISYSTLMRVYLNRLYERLERGLQNEKDILLEKNRLIEAKIKILTDRKNKAKFLDIIENSANRKEAVQVINKTFGLKDEAIVMSLMDIAYSSGINKGELFKKEISENLKAIEVIDGNLKDINKFMIDKFKSLAKIHDRPRRTRMVDVDKLYDSDMLWKHLLIK